MSTRVCVDVLGVLDKGSYFTDTLDGMTLLEVTLYESQYTKLFKEWQDNTAILALVRLNRYDGGYWDLHWVMSANYYKETDDKDICIIRILTKTVLHRPFCTNMRMWP
jgi:hypothetical protein